MTVSARYVPLSRAQTEHLIEFIAAFDHHRTDPTAHNWLKVLEARDRLAIEEREEVYAEG